MYVLRKGDTESLTSYHFSLCRAVRDHRAGYHQSLAVLEHAKNYDAQRSSERAGHLVTKSSIMLGFGETDEEVHKAMADLRLAGVDCDIHRGKME